MTKKEAKRKCARIAREAGADLTWLDDGDYGYYIPGTNQIFVGGSTVQAMLTIFCHELGHYKNYLSGKYYKYHHLKGKPFMRTFKKKKTLVKYALNAEVYTDKVGKKLCAEYFPGVVYKGSYKLNKKFYDMMYQKYFGGYYIIVVGECVYLNNEAPEIIFDVF